MAWWKTAKVGDKVVCVSVPKISSVRGVITPDERIGRVYTIHGFDINDWYDSGVGINIGFRSSRGGLVFTDAKHFRPAVNRSSETGVAALKRHLIGAPVKEGVK